MNAKIGTKEKFTVITPEESVLLSENVKDLNDLLLPFLQADKPHIVLNMGLVKSMDADLGRSLAVLQSKFYENHCSFVICELSKDIEKMLDENELLEIMNVTPTESEAWDILQMEEVERELFGGEE